MARIGPFACAALFKLLLSIVFLATAMPTRAWMTVDYFQLFDLQSIDVGLFTVDVGGNVFSRSDYFGAYNDDFLVTIVLEGVGAGFLLLATLCVVLFLVLRKKSVVLILVYMVAAIVSGVLILAAAAYFRFNIAYEYDYYYYLGYSWYLSLISAFLILGSIGTMGSSLKRGEVDSGSVASRVTTVNVQNQRLK